MSSLFILDMTEFSFHSLKYVQGEMKEVNDTNFDEMCYEKLLQTMKRLAPHGCCKRVYYCKTGAKLSVGKKGNKDRVMPPKDRTGVTKGKQWVQDGWLEGCKKVIGLDGYFLKHTSRGELLTAMGRDANTQMYPIAWVVVRVENAEIGGLLDVVHNWLPEAEHRKSMDTSVTSATVNEESVVEKGKAVGAVDQPELKRK
ncbi:hypothetical protein Tco_0839453 [Tanacetum coccineum]|uniref:Uncharacterized protein n=1 Tax=Tanacetum coccineum TaxID=301880 RepID=A0ABQ5ARS3_9ASTR